MLSEEIINKIYNNACKNNETLIFAGHGDGRDFTTIAGEGTDVFIKLDDIIDALAKSRHIEFEEVIKDIVEIHRLKIEFDERKDDLVDFGEDSKWHTGLNG